MKTINKMLDELDGQKLVRSLVALLILSILATLLAQALGYKDIAWTVYPRFVLASVQRVPLVIVLEVLFGYVFCRTQGINGFKMIRDTVEPWVSITLGFSLIGAIMLVSIILA